MTFLQHPTIPKHLVDGPISHFSGIVNRICALWGYAELNEYLSSLFISDYHGREGFPPEVFKQLIHIQEIHNRTFPHLLDNSPHFTFI